MENTYKKKKYTSNHSRKQNKTKWLIALAVALVLISAVILLIPKGISFKLLGVWQYNEYTKYEFSKNRTGCLYIDDVKYEYDYIVKGDKLEMDFKKDIVTDCEYTFEVKGQELILIGGEGTDGGTYSLKKQPEK